jgi:hypothetical protein
MGFFSNILDEILKPIYPLEVLQKQKGKPRSICAAVEDADNTVEDLTKVSAYLETTKFMPEFDGFAGRVEQIQEGILAVSSTLSTAKNVCANIKSVAKIGNGIAKLNDIGDDLRQDPEGAAEAFGELLSGVGELAQYLPFPANSYLGIFSDAKDFFVNVRRNMQPEVHMKERDGTGTVKDVIDNL